MSPIQVVKREQKMIKSRKVKSNLETRLEATDRILKYFSERKRRSIENSLVRPLYQEVLRTLFIILSMLTCIFIPLQLLLDFFTPLNYIASPLMFLILFYVELKIYEKIWGKKGIWSIEKYKGKN